MQSEFTSENNLFVFFHREEIWQWSASIPALLFLTPVQNDPLSVSRQAGGVDAFGLFATLYG